MKNRSYTWTNIAAILGFLAVAAGAFGAHALKQVLSEEMLKTFNTSVHYHLIHSVLLFCLSTSSYKFKYSKTFILIGVLLFSFSLYSYSLTQLRGFAIITPFGGLSLLAGWLFIIYEVRRKDE